MRKEITNLVETARRSFSNPKAASAAADFVLATALAKVAPLPSTAVENPDVYYASSVASAVATTANQAAKYSLVSASRIIRLARVIWLHRYDVVYSAMRINLLFGLSNKDLGEPELAESIAQGAFQEFVFRSETGIAEACKALTAHYDGVALEISPPEPGEV